VNFKLVISILEGVIVLECILIAFLFLYDKQFKNRITFIISCYLIIRAIHFSVLISGQSLDKGMVELIQNICNNLYGSLLLLITIYSLNKTRKLSVLILLFIFSPFLYTIIINVFLPKFTINKSIEFITNLTYAIFSIISIVLIFLNKKRTRRFKETSFNLNHLLTLLSFLLIFSLIQVISYYAVISFIDLQSVTLFKMLTLSYFISILIFVNGLIYLGLKYPENISNISYLKKRMRSVPEGKYAYSSLEQAEAQKIIDKFNAYLKNNHFYRNSSLSLEDVSFAIGEYPQDVSQSLNQYLNKNFKECVNDLRLIEASRLLSKKDEQNLIIKEIMYSVGFNSKSTFNSLFKKKFGCTPRNYRNLKE